MIVPEPVPAPLVDAAEMARILGIPRDSLYELALAGELKGVYRVGNRWRFSSAEVLAAIRWTGSGQSETQAVVSLAERQHP